MKGGLKLSYSFCQDCQISKQTCKATSSHKNKIQSHLPAHAYIERKICCLRQLFHKDVMHHLLLNFNTLSQISVKLTAKPSAVGKLTDSEMQVKTSDIATSSLDFIKKSLRKKRKKKEEKSLILLVIFTMFRLSVQ